MSLANLSSCFFVSGLGTWMPWEKICGSAEHMADLFGETDE